MKKLLSRVAPFVGIATIVGVTAALALSVPPVFSPRAFNTQQTHYERHVITLTSASCVADNGGLGQTAPFGGSIANCVVKVGALPYNAFILRGNWFQATACNAVTTCTMSIGTSQANANELVSAQDIKTAATGAPALTIVTAGQGAQALGNGIAQTGTDGGFDLWVKIAQTGNSVTAGTIVFDLEYLAGNDGGCTPLYVPMGTTAPAC
jgi:hypothetical protein